jgi:ketosteroid isomerase-like protein
VTVAAPGRHIALLDEFFDGLERGEVDDAAIDSLTHPDCEFTSAIGSEVAGRTFHGRDEIRGWFADLVQTMEVRYRNREFRSIGEKAILMLTTNILRGKGSGAEVVREIGVIYQLEDGLVRRAVSYGSQADALAAAKALELGA